MKLKFFIPFVVLLLFSFTLITGLALLSGAAKAAPETVSNPEVFKLNASSIAATTTWEGPAPAGLHEYMDVFYEIDQGSTINTTG